MIKISARLVTRVSAAFAVLCFGFAIFGLTSLEQIADPVELDRARSTAGLWMFLAGVALMIGVLGWWINRTSGGNE